MSVSASAPSVEQSSAGQTRRWIDRAGRLWCWLGDGLNPILVKEARQAMKSRFFGAMFAILLALSWGASIFTLALIGPDARFGNQGPVLFSVYHGILCFWLLVVIPFSAYRSLAVEQEDRTYELVSITTLNPRQIVRGKLGSVLVQMVVYLSALAPCLAFTYLLRGIDLVTIFFLLGHTVLASIGLAMLGLLWSTLTSSRHWQVIFTVVLIIGLLAVFFPALSLEVALMAELGGVIPFDEPQFWAIDAAIVSILGGYALLAYFAAAARITFPGDNRSTRLRVMMLAEQLVLLFWMIWAFLSFGIQEDAVEALFVLSGLHWYAMGVLMTGESPALSRRVKRSLPQSLLGRVFLTWFNPGPGTGLVFALANMAAVAIVGMIAVTMVYAWRPESVSWRGSDPFVHCAGFALVATGYLTMYLGLGALLLRLLRRLGGSGLVLTLLVHLLVVLVGCFVPTVIQLMAPALRSAEYTFLQVPNAIWTLAYLADRPNSPELPAVMVTVSFLAIVVFLGNLPFVAREVRQSRLPEPQRVREEEAALAAARRPPQPVRISPWDELPPERAAERPDSPGSTQAPPPE